MSKWLRRHHPRFYQMYQEVVGEISYEALGGGPVIRALLKRRLARLERSTGDPVETAFTFEGIGLYDSIHPYQVQSEIRRLYETVRARRPRVVCEIGSDKGGTFFLWSRAMAPDGLAVSIEIPRLYRKSLNRFFSGFFTGSRRVDFVRKDSHFPECRRRLEAILAGRPIDFLFIDGDHSYTGVRLDFQMYAPLVRPGGMVVFHDIVPDVWPEEKSGVDRLWRELKAVYPHEEYIENPQQDGCGIGVIHYDPALRPRFA